MPESLSSIPDALRNTRSSSPSPFQLTDLAYEAIEAIRASLDHATYAVAIACGSKRPDLIHFPIADTPAYLENEMKGRLKNFPPDILALFRGFQPYQGGNQLIWALNQVRRQATHRLIIPVGTINGPSLIRSMKITSPLPLDVPPLRWNGEKDEIVFAVTGPGSDLQYNVEFTLFVTFGAVEGVADEPLIETLTDMTAEAERIVLAIEAEARRIGLIS